MELDRNKSEYMTIINTKKGQRISGQDTCDLRFIFHKPVQT